MTGVPPPEPISGVILAGGFGSRLGRDKATAKVAGRPLLHWTAEALARVSDDLVVVARPRQDLPAPPRDLTWRVVRDRRHDAGPLAGIEAALPAVQHDIALVVATDMPLLNPALLRALAAAAADYDAVMPHDGDRAQPLLAAYRRACLPAATAMLDAGERRPRLLLQRVRGRALPLDDLRPHDPGLRSLTNVNRPADLRRVAAILAQAASSAPTPLATPGPTQGGSP